MNASWPPCAESPMTLLPTACLVISVRLLSRQACAMNTKVKRNKRKYTSKMLTEQAQCQCAGAKLRPSSRK